MKIGIYLCECGSNISEKIDYEQVKNLLKDLPYKVYFHKNDFFCADEGKTEMEKDIRKNKPDRVIVAACSPREHESTFMRVLASAGINPYYLQLVNLREQVAWVTEDKEKATAKAARYLAAAVKRVALHEPLEKREIDVSPDVLIIGAGPAGLKTALAVAESGRKAVIVERTPVIGGLPVRFEELFPNMECGPCMLEPLMGEILHGEDAERIELLTMAEVEEVVGSYGNYTVKIRQTARYVDEHACIGCAECVEPCPVSYPNRFNCNMSERKAISFPYAGALPNAPSIDSSLCLKLKGEDCDKCREACPVEDAIRFDDADKVLERQVGAIVVATGADLYDCGKIPNLGYGKLPDVYTSLEFERIAASNGPTDGEIRLKNGKAPKSVAIVHCVGSLDPNHREYCSGVCCQYAFKFSHLLSDKLPGVKIAHLYKELAVAGKDGAKLYAHARHAKSTDFIRYADIKDMQISGAKEGTTIQLKDSAGKEQKLAADMVILCPASVPAAESAAIARVLELATDRTGFFEELHGRTDAAQSKLKGIYLAGTCQAPGDIQRSMSQGMAAAGYALSGLVPGRKLEIQPIVACIDPDKCSGCRVCVAVCPYKAISYDEERKGAQVNDVLCHGCGTCVAACPAGVATANHFTNKEILAEIEGVLG